MHNRTTAHASAIAAGVLLALFAALTVSLVFVDRQPIAGDGSLVGLATFNLDARTILGQSNLMEKLSNLLLIVPAVGALMIAIVGCKQLIRSRSRSGVDRDLWLLLGIYGAMLVLYVLFNCISPNNRPILEDGVCEPSFPSSHTLLAVTMCGTAMIQAVQRIRQEGLRTAALVICAVGMVGIVAARAMAGVHWPTDILGGILLGTGGLVRAYTAAAKDALLDAGVNEMRQWASLRVTCPYSLYDRVRLEAEKLGAVFENTNYGADITLALLLPEEAAEPFAQTLRELSAGRLVPEKVGSVFRGVLRK